ncbi:hypothetical protein [Chitinophaga barathri]|uniref:Uncharacterized protein n=1 Tax=Chitinophaga barathri TaxID=1647451 RepID=A0A3N4M547_9BACT|nr:hypothetical protein [Chitinophaga barathri]RPD38292.1 hypothetical protein EG028_25715 [Chitinophaga barathri]
MKYYFQLIGLAILFSCQQAPVAEQPSDTIISPMPATAATPVEQAAPVVLDSLAIGDTMYNVITIGKTEFDTVPEQEWRGDEELKIKTFAGRAERLGDSLAVKLDDGKRLFFVNRPPLSEDNPEGERIYEFLHYLPGLKSTMVISVGDEMFSYMLIHTGTGNVLETIGEPQFSPDMQRFICSNADLDAHFNPNGFELFRVKGNKIIKVQSALPEKWGPVIIKWRDARSFVAHIKELDAEMREHDRYVKLVPRY